MTLLLLVSAWEAAAQDGGIPGVAPGEEQESRVPADEAQEEGAGAGRSGRDVGTVVVVTATRQDQHTLDTPHAATVLETDALLGTGEGRSLPNMLTREPGVLMQKTGPGQTSPYIRGFTGFRTLWLMDGIRLNNSVWRDGPNQYSGTIDLFAVDRLELIRGPGSVLWGSDAIGGTVSALSDPGDASDGWHVAYEGRWASAERSFMNRLEFEGGREGDIAVRGGITEKDFGTLHAGAGSGDLRGTAYDERDYDLRIDVSLDERVELTFGAQSVRQDGVPRTHKTVDSVSFHSTTVGSELKRELDQERDLVYARLAWEAGAQAFYEDAELTVSWQRQSQERNRRRTGGRRDVQGFDVPTVGAQLEMRSDTSVGELTYGVDAYHDDVDSYSKAWVNGVSTGKQIQGPVGDDAEYDLLGLYVQDAIAHGDFETTVGARYTYARAEADRVDNPNVPGSDPSTPGNVLKVDESWSDVIGSVRSLLHVSDETSVYAGLSQGFRAPNLSDLTSDLEDSGVEQPTPDLDPERFLTLELGAKAEQDSWQGEVAVYGTWIDDMIVRSPTGEVVGGTPVVQKDNVGDGFLWGIEVRGERELGGGFSAYASAAYLDGEVDQFKLPSGEKVRKPIDRLMPLTALTGVAYSPEGRDWWMECDVLMVDEADRLSLRDETDTERIPPGGTPGYGVLGVRGGIQVTPSASVGVAVENVFNKDFRIHGSGQNEPGRNLVVSTRIRL